MFQGKYRIEEKLAESFWSAFRMNEGVKPGKFSIPLSRSWHHLILSPSFPGRSNLR